MNEDLVATITHARFTSVVQQGYVMGDVDDFLDRLVAHLSVGASVRDMIEANHFPVASWTETYDRYDVDLLLSQVKHKAQVDPDAPLPAPEVAPPARGAMPHVPQPRAEAMTQKKGLLARIFTAD